MSLSRYWAAVIRTLYCVGNTAAPLRLCPANTQPYRIASIIQQHHNVHISHTPLVTTIIKTLGFLTHHTLTPIILPSSNSSKTLPRRKGVVRPPPPKPSRQDSPRNLGLATSTTPAPPTTPSSGPGFKCRGEGFFGHPTSCKKYYWCLDTPNEGTVAHTFSCPKGLYFNEYTDGCDFLRNVDCAGKDTTETEKTEADKAESNEDDDEESDEEDPKSLKNILQLVRERGGVEGLEEEIEKEEHAKKKEDDRKERISAKTRNRLTQLLKGRQREAGLASKSAQEKLESLSRNQPSDATTKPPTTKSTQSFRSRTLNRKPSNFFRNRGSSRSLSRTPSTSRTPTTTRPTPSRPTRPRFTFRNRSHLFSRTSPAPRTSPTPLPSEEIPTTLDPELSDPQSDDESNTKIQIVGAHLEPEEPEEKPLHLGVFKPKAGVREKLRDTLHNALMEEMANRPKELEQSTISPVSTVTISKNTRIEGDNIGRTRETVRGFATRRREQHLDRISTNKPQDSNRIRDRTHPTLTRSKAVQEDKEYVTIQRGRATTQDPPTEDKVQSGAAAGSDSDYISSGDFRPTVSDVLVPTESPAPPPNTTPPNQVSLTTTLPSLREQPRRLDVFNIDENPSIGTLDGDLDAVDEDQEKDEDADIHSGTSHDSQSITEPLSVKGRPDPARGRSKRPVSNKVSFRQRFRGRSRARGRNPPSPRATITRAPPTITRAPTSITRAPVSITRTPEPITRAPELKTRAPEPVTRPTLPPTTDPISITTALVNTPKALAPITRDPAPLVPIGPLEDQSVIPVRLSEDTFNTPVRQQLEPEYEYEYYYDYLDTEEDTTNTEYDLVPLTNKVRILSDGLPHCFDVGVFPHPYSCKKFINCYRNPGQGIQGSIYQCPSYLAFDPVGGRCNWVNEIVCASRS